MPTYDGIGSSVTHEIEVVGDVFISNVEGGSLSTQVPFEIFSNVSGLSPAPTDSRQLRLRVQPTTEASPDDSYVTDMGIQNTTDNYFFITAPQNTSNVGDQNTFVISKTSNVGIGTTDPLATLQVVGDIKCQTLTASNIVGGSPLTISSDQNLQVNSNLTVGNSNLFVDNTTGRVGIGTTDPKTKLHVSHDLHLQSSSEEWNSTAGPGLYLRYSTYSGQNEGYIQSIERSSSTLKPMVLEASTFNLGGGNVGIGVASPTQKLDVNGYIKQSNTYFFVGESTVEFSSTINFGNTSIINNGSHWNTTNRRFTAPVKGIYIFTFNGYTVNEEHFGIGYNGNYPDTSSYNGKQLWSINGGTGGTSSWMLQLNANDFITLALWQSGSLTGSRCYFAGGLLYAV